MKYILLIFILTVSSHTCLGQTKKITQILNKQFQKEQKWYDEIDIEKPYIYQEFKIENDSLSFEFYYAPQLETQQKEITRRVVHLKDLKDFSKDYSILFLTEANSVMEKIYLEKSPGQKEILHQSITDMFFTELRKDRKDEILQKNIIKAFSKAGYTITGKYWYH